MTALTPTQLRVLDFIRQCVLRRSLPPTRHEIALEFDFRSDNAAECHLQALERKGFIQLIPSIARGIRLTSLPPSVPAINGAAPSGSRWRSSPNLNTG